MKFSQRIGEIAVSEVIQTRDISDDLRHSLWNVLDRHFFSRQGFLVNEYNQIGSIDGFSRKLWEEYFKRRVDLRPQWGYEILSQIRNYFFDAEWYQVYDFCEFIIQEYSANRFFDSEKLENDFNNVLERELSGYRILNDCFVPITSQQELDEVENASRAGEFEGVSIHLNRAIFHLSDRDNPDYRNSTKESISAVESMACELTRNPSATLGDALRSLETNKSLHGALRAGFSSIYGYTSDANGIRHAMLEEDDLDQADAIYFLVACSAFINYLKQKAT